MTRQNNSRIQSPRHGNSHCLPAGKISRKVRRQSRAQFLIVRLLRESRLVLPLTRLEVCALTLQLGIPERPCGGGGQYMNVFENRAVLKNTTVSDKLSEGSRIAAPKPGVHFQNRLGFGGEIETILGLVIAQPMHTVAIVENRRNAARPVQNQPVKHTIQILNKIRVFFILAEQVSGFGPVT